jgi:hypothetical protein
VKKEDASTDIIVHIMEFVTHVAQCFLIALNVLFTIKIPFLNTNALNGRTEIALWIVARYVNLTPMKKKKFAKNAWKDLI